MRTELTPCSGDCLLSRNRSSSLFPPFFRLDSLSCRSVLFRRVALWRWTRVGLTGWCAGVVVQATTTSEPGPRKRGPRHTAAARLLVPGQTSSVGGCSTVGVVGGWSSAGRRRRGGGDGRATPREEMPDQLRRRHSLRHTVLAPRRPPPDVPSTSPPFDGGHRRQARTPTTAGGVRAGLGGARRRARGPGTEARAAAAARTSQGRDVGARRRDGVRQPVTLR